VRLLDEKLQNPYSFLAAKKIKQIISTTSLTDPQQKRQLYIMKELNNKLTKGNAIVTQADKGKTIVLIDANEYANKAQIFLTANKFSILTKDPTNKFQKQINQTMQQCNLIIDKRQIKHLTQKKPNPPPALKAQLKLHKKDIPIRPVINNRTAPAYKLAKYLTKALNHRITVNNHYNITNSINLANDFIRIDRSEKHRLITFDIQDLFVNVPIEETINITRQRLLHNNGRHTTQQTLALLTVVLNQNYFSFQQKIYQPNQGTVMGSQISRIIAEIFLQQYEDTHIKQLSDTKKIAYYARYVDDILIIYDETNISPQDINLYTENIHKNIKLNTSYEEKTP